MKFDQHNKYPQCGALFQNYLCMIDVLSPKVWDAFVEVCEDEELAREAITWGKNPKIAIVKFVKDGYEQLNVPGMYQGHCNLKERDIVYLNRHNASGYEEYRDNWQNIERIVFHEMVHWARFRARLPGRASGNREAGNLFEERAYGTTVIRDHDDLACP